VTCDGRTLVAVHGATGNPNLLGRHDLATGAARQLTDQRETASLKY